MASSVIIGRPSALSAPILPNRCQKHLYTRLSRPVSQRLLFRLWVASMGGSAANTKPERGICPPTCNGFGSCPPLTKTVFYDTMEDGFADMSLEGQEFLRNKRRRYSFAKTCCANW